MAPQDLGKNANMDRHFDATGEAPDAANAAGDQVQSWASPGATMSLFVLAGLAVVGQMYIVLPMLTQMADTFGTDAQKMVAASTAFGFAYAAGFLCAGPMTDHFGPRRIIVAGLLLSGAVAMGLCAVSVSMPLLLSLRTVQGFVAAMFLPAALSYVATRIRPEVRVLMISCVTTSAFAAAIAMQAAAQLLVGVVGWRGVFMLSGAAIMILGVLARILLLHNGGLHKPAGLKVAFTAIPSLLARPAMLALYIASLLLLGSFVSMYAAIALAGPESLADSPSGLMTLRLSGLPAMIAVPLLAPFLKRFPALRRVIFGFCVSALSAAGAMFAADSVMLLALMLLVFVAATAMTAPAIIEHIGVKSAGNPGAATALYGFSMFLGASIGSQAVGALRDQGFTTFLAAIAVACGIGAALAVLSRLSSK